jgi:hypothetical protein
MKRTNLMAVVYAATKYYLLLIGFVWLTNISYAQGVDPAVTPPTLKDGSSWEAALRLKYHEQDYHYSIITVRFRIDDKGMLDTLYVDGGAKAQQDAFRGQLLLLNGKWKPQQQQGKSIKSKWMCFRWYISGAYHFPEGCTKNLWEEMKAGYAREELLFQCSTSPYKCRTYFIEGSDYFWFPPLYSEVQQ